ncbi:MAG: hypothetical protein PHV59_11760 [Victivallales bacterium]|nr:hypothetical protein [Victivallales bacterium]
MNAEIILAVNVGSTSFKFQALDAGNGKSYCRGNIQRVFSPKAELDYSCADGYELHERLDMSGGYHHCIELLLQLLQAKNHRVVDSLTDIYAIGFKAVHGGRFDYPVLVTPEVLEAMRSNADAAPAHNLPYLEAMECFTGLLPETPLAAVFESAFHRDLPEYASGYAVPYEWREKYGAKRYGFHGASHNFVARKTVELTGIDGRIISCHLGGSSSVCAVANGKSRYCSMGFSPQSGLPMANRCGDLDPFLLLRVMEQENYSPAEMRRVLSGRCGLLGISGISGDVRDLEADASPRAELALRTFAWESKNKSASAWRFWTELIPLFLPAASGKTTRYYGK